MGNVVYEKGTIPNEKDIESIYNDANWTTYVNATLKLYHIPVKN